MNLDLLGLQSRDLSRHSSISLWIGYRSRSHSFEHVDQLHSSEVPWQREQVRDLILRFDRPRCFLERFFALAPFLTAVPEFWPSTCVLLRISRGRELCVGAFVPNDLQCISSLFGGQKPLAATATPGRT